MEPGGPRGTRGPRQRQRIARPQVDRALAVLVASLDARSAGWGETREHLCRARLERTSKPAAYPDALDLDLDLDRRQQACLDDARAGLEAQLAELRAATRDLGPHYTLAAAAIEALPGCDERPLLATWPVGKTNSDADISLARALAAEVAGRYPEAEARAREVAKASADVDPLREAEALYRLGHVLGQERRREDALRALDHARDAAFAIGHDELVCRAAAYQAAVSAAVDEGPAQAVQARRELGLANACVQRVGSRSPILRGDLLEAAGLLAEASDEFEIAILRHRESLALRRSFLGQDHVATTKSLHNLANALAATGQPERVAEARTRYRECLELRTALLGDHHPELADLLFDLGEFERAQGEFETAEQHLRRASAIYAMTPSAHGLLQSRIHLALAALSIEASDLVTATAELGEARSLQAVVSGGLGSLDGARALHLEGIIALRSLDYRAAADAFRRARPLYRRTHPTAEAALDCVVNEIEAVYGLDDVDRIAAIERDESEDLERYIRTLDPSERGLAAWYLGDALSRAEQFGPAATYLQIAVAAYDSIGDEISAAQLRELLEHSADASPKAGDQ